MNNAYIKKRLDNLKACIRSARAIQREGKARVIKKDLLYTALERHLELACSAVLDVGGCLIVRQGLKKPISYVDIIPILVEGKIIPKKNASRTAALAGIRETLIHDAPDRDRAKIFDFVRDALPAIEEVGKGFKKFLKI